MNQTYGGEDLSPKASPDWKLDLEYCLNPGRSLEIELLRSLGATSHEVWTDGRSQDRGKRMESMTYHTAGMTLYRSLLIEGGRGGTYKELTDTFVLCDKGRS